MKIAECSQLEKHLWSPVSAFEMLDQAKSKSPMFGSKLLFVTVSQGKAVTFRVEDPRDFPKEEQLEDDNLQRLLTRNAISNGRMDINVEEVEELRTKWEGKKMGKLLMIRAPSQTVAMLEMTAHQVESLPWICEQLGIPVPTNTPKAAFDPFNL